MAPFDRLSMVSYYFSLVTLSLKRTVFEIFVFKNAETLMTGLRPSRSLEIIAFDKAHMTSFWRSVVTMALSCVVSEIFNVEKCRDLKLGLVVTQKWSLKVVLFSRPCIVSYCDSASYRAFSIAAPLLWNSLPAETRNVATLETFKKKLKTFMFYKHLGDWL